MNSTVMETCPAPAASRYAGILLGCFRRGEAEDGPVYVRAVVALLTSYPEAIVKAVCDPRGGLPSHSQFLPTIYEIRVACEKRLRPLLDAEARRRRDETNEADRPAPVSEEGAARRKAFIADWRRRTAVAGERDIDPGRADRELRDLCAVHGVDPDSLADRPRMRSPKSLGAVASNLKG